MKSIKKYKKLSTLKNAKKNCITYYTGNNIDDVSHLKSSLLICNKDFNPNLNSVEVLKVSDPQLFFYKLSKKFKKNYLELKKLKKSQDGTFIKHEKIIIGKKVKIYPNCVLGKCIIGNNTHIHPNCTIYSETKIGKNVIIESNSVIGAEGVMWVWHNGKKVKLHQLGKTEIQNGVFIGSNVTIVRGSANETTTIGEGTYIAHGTKIGHGCVIGKNNHFANNVSIAGSVKTADNCFFGSGCVVLPNVKINHVIILGAGSTLTSSPTEPGIYVGSPAKKIKEISKHKGVPNYKKPN